MTKLIAIHYLILASTIRGVLDEIAPGKAFAARADEMGLVERGVARKPNASEHDLPVVKRAGPQQEVIADANDNTATDAAAAASGHVDTPTAADTRATASAEEGVSLTELTVAQLNELAASEGIDLGKTKRRDDIIAIIRTTWADRAASNEDDMI